MEENTVRTDEIEEYDQDEIEVDDTPEGTSAGGAFVAGMAGGFLAYTFIMGLVKLATLTQTWWTERKLKREKAAINTDYTVIENERMDSEEEPPENK